MADMSERTGSTVVISPEKKLQNELKVKRIHDELSKAIQNLGNPHYAEELSKKELAGCNDGYGDDELSKLERVEELSDSGDRKIGDGDFQGAVEDLSEAIRLDPQNSRCYGLRGTAYYEMGRYEKSIEDDSKAIDLHSDPTYLYNRAESYYKTGKDDEALSDLSHALELAREMPIYHYLIPEIRKLVNIIEDKTLNGEDYYQPPIGWEKNKKSQELDARYEEYDDVGPEVVPFIYTSMRIDDEWSTKSLRGFTWWGHGLAQRVWAEECRRDEGMDVTLMHAETDFLRNVENNRQTLEGLNLLNAGTAEFAFIYDPEEQRIRLHTSVYTHCQNVDWSKRYFLGTVGLQMSYAHIMVESGSHLFHGSGPDVTPHPDNGHRQDRDEMVNLVELFFIPLNAAVAPIESIEFQFAADYLSFWSLATWGEGVLTAEFPFSGEEPAHVRMAQGLEPVTALFQAVSSEEHPLLGKGLMTTLKLPLSYNREDGLKIASVLNLLEMKEWAKCHLNGAWYVDDRNCLSFISFMPIASYKRQLLVHIAMNFYIRSQWAREILKEHKKGADDSKHMGGLEKVSESWDPGFCLHETYKGKSKKWLH
jgi:hypothetical protein